MSCWAKVVWLVVVTAIVVIVVAPDVDLQPTVTRVSRALQKPGIAIAHAIKPIVVMLPLLVSSTLPRRTAPHAKGDSFADLIDLTCCRLC
ncbi:MAG TPA: hypothetical protein VIB39_19425 [Candidatus Angelobacter sp.]